MTEKMYREAERQLTQPLTDYLDSLKKLNHSSRELLAVMSRLQDLLESDGLFMALDGGISQRELRAEPYKIAGTTRPEFIPGTWPGRQRDPEVDH